MARETELLTEQVNCSISSTTLRQLEEIERTEGIKPGAFGRIAILEKLAGRQNELTAAAREARALGLDPVAAIRAQLATATITSP